MIGEAGTRQFSCDKLGRHVSIHTNHFQEDIPADGYNPIGNLTQMTVQDALGHSTNQYNYSDLSQLISESGDVSHHYAYDSIHNRLAKDTAQYTVSSLNRVESDSEATYVYDLNGNLIAKLLHGQTTTYTYDALNRLVSVRHGQDLFEYTYDSFGRRVSKRHGDSLDNYLYQCQREIGLMQDDILAELRVLGSGKGAELGAAIALELNGSLFAPVHDHRGNICCLIDTQTGQISATYRYSAFGETIRSE